MYVCTENDHVDIGVSTENEAMRFSYDLKTKNIAIPLYVDRTYLVPLNEIESRLDMKEIGDKWSFFDF